MPWLRGITLFHVRKDMDQLFGLTCFGDDFLDTVIFTESTEFTDEFNFNTIFISNALCILSNLFRKRLRKIWKIKNTDRIRFRGTTWRKASCKCP